MLQSRRELGKALENTMIYPGAELGLKSKTQTSWNFLYECSVKFHMQFLYTVSCTDSYANLSSSVVGVTKLGWGSVVLSSRSVLGVS